MKGSIFGPTRSMKGAKNTINKWARLEEWKQKLLCCMIEAVPQTRKSDEADLMVGHS
jgi:hypothetical protein